MPDVMQNKCEFYESFSSKYMNQKAKSTYHISARKKCHTNGITTNGLHSRGPVCSGLKDHFIIRISALFFITN